MTPTVRPVCSNYRSFPLFLGSPAGASLCSGHCHMLRSTHTCFVCQPEIEAKHITAENSRHFYKDPDQRDPWQATVKK